MPTDMAAQEVGLVDIEVKDVAKGFRAETLKLKTVVNEKGEAIGKIDDFIFSRDGGQVFVVLAVGDLTGLHGNLIAVPFQKLQFGDGANKVVLPGATREALTKLPVFLHEK
uniref:PRC-barrel domain-containing protein n=1 Tax=Neorhizobium sp. EC2-8 TaxID=3129230 RepID=UPI0031018798